MGVTNRALGYGTSRAPPPSMNTQALAASILHLEARLAVQHDAADDGHLELWAKLIGDLLGLLEPPQNTRSSWRVPLDGKVLVRWREQAMSLETVNVSHTGLCLQGDLGAIAPGDSGELLLAEAEDVRFPLVIPFRVRWCRNDGGVRKMGVEFINEVDESWQARFERWYVHAFDVLLRDLAAGKDVLRGEPS